MPPTGEGLPGPVAESFFAATDTVQALNGPVGGGKTYTLFLKFCWHVPMLQPPSPVDGVRRRVITVVHQDYRRLWRGPIATYNKLFPKDLDGSVWNGGRNEPATHKVAWRHPVDKEHPRVEVTVNFIAIGDNDVEDVMRGYETSDWLLMEADLLSEQTFTYAMTRLARAPGREHGTLLNPAVGLDFNAPTFDSWVFERMMNDWEPGRRLFVQPPAAFEVPGEPGRFNLNPQAENLHNLDDGYYQRQIDELGPRDPDLIRRFVCNKPGYNKSGLPVYGKEYSDIRHVSSVGLQPDYRLPLYIGLDAGGDPCAALGQVVAGGAVRVLAELIADHGTGPDRFGMILEEFLAQPRWQPFRRDQITCFPDPSAFWGGDAESQALSDQDWVTKFRHRTKLECRMPDVGNKLFDRLKAVKDKLLRQGEEVGLLLDPHHCQTLRKGFVAGYCYGEVKRANSQGRYIPALPVKNEFSHIHDATQYLIMGAMRYPKGAQNDRQRRQVRATTPGRPAAYAEVRR